MNMESTLEVNILSLWLNFLDAKLSCIWNKVNELRDDDQYPQFNVAKCFNLPALLALTFLFLHIVNLWFCVTFPAWYHFLLFFIHITEPPTLRHFVQF